MTGRLGNLAILVFVLAFGAAFATGCGPITEEDLVRMDEQHSLDNSIEYEGTRYHYSNSGESFFFEGGSTEGQGFYLWELANEDNERFASIVKWEGMPFEAYLSESVSPDSITVYRQ